MSEFPLCHPGFQFDFIDLFIFTCTHCSIYFWLRWVFVTARGLSLVGASGGLLFLAMDGLLVAVASLVVQHSRRVCGCGSCDTQA